MATVAVTINSRKYDVVADESAEYIEMLCAHINEKVDLVLRTLWVKDQLCLRH